MKPNLYLDIDGVLLLDWNPQNKKWNINEWLFVLILKNIQKFDGIFWLSAWTHAGSTEFLYEQYPEFEQLKAVPLVWAYNKTEAIDWKNPFIWIEDEVMKEEVRIFNNRATSNQQIWNILGGSKQ